MCGAAASFALPRGILWNVSLFLPLIFGAFRVAKGGRSSGFIACFLALLGGIAALRSSSAFAGGVLLACGAQSALRSLASSLQMSPEHFGIFLSAICTAAAVGALFAGLFLSI